MISNHKDTEEIEIKISIRHTVCHFDEGEISTRNSTKIGDILYGATRGDFSFVEMTN